MRVTANSAEPASAVVASAAGSCIVVEASQDPWRKAVDFGRVMADSGGEWALKVGKSVDPKC